MNKLRNMYNNLSLNVYNDTFFYQLYIYVSFNI